MPLHCEKQYLPQHHLLGMFMVTKIQAWLQLSYTASTRKKTISNGHVSGLYSFIKDMSLAWNDTQPNSSVTLVRLINANLQTSTEKKGQWTLTRNQQGCGLTRRNEVRACNEKRCFRDTKTRQVTENKDGIVFLSYEIHDRKAKKKRPFCFDNIQNN